LLAWLSKERPAALTGLALDRVASTGAGDGRAIWSLAHLGGLLRADLAWQSLDDHGQPGVSVARLGPVEPVPWLRSTVTPRFVLQDAHGGEWHLPAILDPTGANCVPQRWTLNGREPLDDLQANAIEAAQAVRQHAQGQQDPAGALSAAFASPEGQLQLMAMAAAVWSYSLHVDGPALLGAGLLDDRLVTVGLCTAAGCYVPTEGM
jgi:hypothetical protein